MPAPERPAPEETERPPEPVGASDDACARFDTAWLAAREPRFDTAWVEQLAAEIEKHRGERLNTVGGPDREEAVHAFQLSVKLIAALLGVVVDDIAYIHWAPGELELVTYLSKDGHRFVVKGEGGVATSLLHWTALGPVE